MIDFKKMGEAASNAAAEKSWLQYATASERYEHVGRAAVAAMIPEAENGICANHCPFESTGDDDNYLCSLEWKQTSCRPGPSCPAYKEK